MEKIMNAVDEGVTVFDININTYQGGIPLNGDLVVYEKGKYDNDTAMTLLGFDEVGEFDAYFKEAQYAFVALITEDD
jgi:hypothetical protein